MKIEKLNDNQIRCTLTSEDLASRHLKLSELAYGTESAKNLFRDMMQQASYEFGFEAEDIPLMIEAIPVSSDTIILLITKVEYPEELDTRFSKFSDPHDDDDYERFSDAQNYASASADDILGMFKRLQQETENQPAKSPKKKYRQEDFIPLDQTVRREEGETISQPVELPVDLTKLFIVPNMDTVTRIASVLQNYYQGVNSLFRDQQTHAYYLIVHKTSHTPEEFNKVCNILSEYATQLNFTKSIEAFFDEHMDCIISDNALQMLATL